MIQTSLRICTACMQRTRQRHCPICNRPTKTEREWTEWKILSCMAELTQEQWQTGTGLYMLCGNGTSMHEFNLVLQGLGVKRLIHIERRWDGPRYYREPGALVGFCLGG